MSGRFHLAKEMDVQCVYCASPIDEAALWKSEFEIEMHYKTLRCACGKENVVQVNFHGSGHDEWSEPDSPEQKNTIRELDSFDALVEKEHKNLKAA